MAEAMDFSELRRFTADVNAATRRIDKDVRAVIVKGAVQIQNQLRDEMGASESFGALAGGISFDITGNGFYTEAKIGPNKASRGGGSKIGKGANIAYFGGSNGGGGTVPDPKGALEAEVPKVEKFIADLLGGIL